MSSCREPASPPHQDRGRSKVDLDDQAATGPKKKHPSCEDPEKSLESEGRVGQSVRDGDLLRSSEVTEKVEVEDGGNESDSSEDSTSSSVVMVPTGKETFASFHLEV